MHGGVHAVRGVHARDPRHVLNLEPGELSDVVNVPVLVELGHGFSAQAFADLGGDLDDARHEHAAGEAFALKFRPCLSEDLGGHVAAEVRLDNKGVGVQFDG